LNLWPKQMELINFSSVFHKMSEHITAATTVIHNEGMAAKEIDRCLNGMISL
jgi:TPP-dependent 2-oxoacid decarboxylase